MSLVLIHFVYRDSFPEQRECTPWVIMKIYLLSQEKSKQRRLMSNKSAQNLKGKDLSFQFIWIITQNIQEPGGDQTMTGFHLYSSTNSRWAWLNKSIVLQLRFPISTNSAWISLSDSKDNNEPSVKSCRDTSPSLAKVFQEMDLIHFLYEKFCGCRSSYRI